MRPPILKKWVYAICPFVLRSEESLCYLQCLSETAIRVNIQIIRIFTRMREMIMTHKDILLQLEKIERKLAGHDEDITLNIWIPETTAEPATTTPKKDRF